MYRKNMSIYYHCKNIGNFGDVVSKYIYKKLTGRVGQFSINLHQPHYFITGSILQLATNKTTVLGAGFSECTQVVRYKPNIKIVRGHITKSMLQKQGFDSKILCGDPVSILPKLYYPRIRQKHELGFIPHYIDQDLDVVSKLKNNTDCLYINILDEPERFIQQVLSCKKIISSTLHGMILAHAYNIPARWIKLSNRLAGDDMKFHDYFSSMGISQSFLDCRNGIPTNVVSKIPPETGELKDDIFSVLTRELR